ncbi:E3 ubiquitin-protein ligase LRSAM1 [Rhipicephalus microplus]|uniref:E3 ubiquitin-protein ligase LRSAM1 n=1 Tax=Rhipicephalus microplus TaxID=6941 RepID=UPI003F6C9D25
MSGTEDTLAVGMPLFKKSKESDDYRTKLQRKLYIAQESPDNTFDLSECALGDVPSGVFCKCRVFRKTTLILRNNKLTSIGGGGSLKDLCDITVLDLESNLLVKLPDEFGFLRSLVVLSLKGNALKKLPGSFANLTSLQSLNLSDNKFRDFPLPILRLRKLRDLNITQNEITKLPKNFYELRSLRSFVLDSYNFSFPDAVVCSQPLQSLMLHLCNLAGVEYVPPVDEPDTSDCKEEASVTAASTGVDLEDQYRQFEERRDKRRQELLQIEEELRESAMNRSAVSEITNKHRQELLLEIAREQDTLEDAILEVQSKKDMEKQKLVSLLLHLEKHSAELIQQISNDMRSKNSEMLARALEQEQHEMKELFSMQQQEIDSSRRREILRSMAEILHQEEQQRHYRQTRDSIVKGIQEEEAACDELLRGAIFSKTKQQDETLSRIIDEERYQMEAFKALQLRHDYTHRYLIQQIRLIEKELKKLTDVELKKRDFKVMSDLDILAKHRVELACLLSQLLEEKAMREKQLQDQLKAIEAHRRQEINDFWLIQYQKLLDRKPQDICDLDEKLDLRIRDVLLLANASHYATLFASKNVDWENFIELEWKDFKSLGINSDSIVQMLLSAREQYLVEHPTVKPSAPSPDQSPVKEKAAADANFSILQVPELKLWCSSECVICFEVTRLLVFVPCGHVCCCEQCSAGVNQCPLCRAGVEGKLSAT